MSEGSAAAMAAANPEVIESSIQVRLINYLRFFLVTYMSNADNKSNKCFCLCIFFLANWLFGSLTILLSNRKRSLLFVLPLLTFCSTQIFSGVFSGIYMDLKGRKKSLKLWYRFLLSGISITIASLLINDPNILYELITITNNHSSQEEVPISIETTNFIAPEFISLGTFSYYVFIIGISIMGLGAGGIYPTAAVTLAESVKGSSRYQSIGSLLFMEGLAIFIIRTITGLLYWEFPNISLEIVFFSLLLIAIIFCIILSSLSLAETQAYLKTYRQNIIQNIDSNVSSQPLQIPLLNRQLEITERTWFKFKNILKRYSQNFFYDFFGTSLPWFIFNFLFYGKGIFYFLLVQRIKGFDSDTQENFFALIVSLICLFGYILAIILIKKITPKLILGFVVISFVYFGLALSLYSISHLIIEDQQRSISEFIGASLLYDCVFRFFDFIPNLTIFLIPLNSFPTKIRGTYYGASFSIGQIGTIFGILFFWIFVEPYHFSKSTILSLSSFISLLSAIITRGLTPHVKPDNAEISELDAIYRTRIYHDESARFINQQDHIERAQSARSIMTNN